MLEFSLNATKSNDISTHTTSKIPWEVKHCTSMGIWPSLGTKSVLIYWFGCIEISTEVNSMLHSVFFLHKIKEVLQTLYIKCFIKDL
jgi:hypothetical protein